MQFEDPRLVEACGNCRFYVPLTYDFDDGDVSTNYGECRRFPPKIVPAEEQRFPLVDDELWCGEFDI